MTGYSVTFRQEPKHDLSGAWFDAPLPVMAKARASGLCQTSQSSLWRNSKNDHVLRPAEHPQLCSFPLRQMSREDESRQTWTGDFSTTS